VADASGQDEQMPDAVAPTPPVIQRIEEHANGVEEPTRDQQPEA